MTCPNKVLVNSQFACQIQISSSAFNYTNYLLVIAFGDNVLRNVTWPPSANNLLVNYIYSQIGVYKITIYSPDFYPVSANIIVNISNHKFEKF